MNQDKEKSIKVLNLDEVLKTAKPCLYRTTLQDRNGDTIFKNGHIAYNNWLPGLFLGFVTQHETINLNEAIIYDEKAGNFHRLCVTTEVVICRSKP